MLTFSIGKALQSDTISCPPSSLTPERLRSPGSPSTLVTLRWPTFTLVSCVTSGVRAAQSRYGDDVRSALTLAASASK